MDYRLSDWHIDPAGTDESCYSEKTIRLDVPYWCYAPFAEIDVSPLPALQRGEVTFGCQNIFAKVTEPVWEAWIKILRGAKNSRLLVYAPHGSVRELGKKRFEEAGVDPKRLVWSDATGMDYFKCYGEIDVVLDPFPWGGGTVTCDAIWMGVPVVTLRGGTGVGRGGVSILSYLGLPELIAGSREEYVGIAVGLAGDLGRLAELRGTMRQRMRASPLMDAPGHARGIEESYRKMWHNWCGRR
jgi:protein O-GlcNAc transferase